MVGSSLSPARPDERTRACLAPENRVSLSNNRKIYIAHSLVPLSYCSPSLSLSLTLFFSCSHAVSLSYPLSQACGHSRKKCTRDRQRRQRDALLERTESDHPTRAPRHPDHGSGSRIAGGPCARFKFSSTVVPTPRRLPVRSTDYQKKSESLQ